MQNCSGSCPSMCKNGGGKYQDTLSGQYEIDKTMSISCYYGKNEIKKNKNQEIEYFFGNEIYYS